MVPAPLPLRRAMYLPLLLAACGDDGPRPLSAEVQAELAARADPATWEDLDAEHPGQRLRDPRSGIVFRRIPAGEFTMGGPGLHHEGPEHRVRLTRDLLVAETEVTAGQWRRYVERHGGAAVAEPPADDRMPMGGLCWDDAVAFCGRYGYRLPTEAEWEYACRDHVEAAAAPWRSTEALLDYAWFHRNAADRGPQQVGTRRPNAFGLHDTLGNLWEWTADWIGSYPKDGGTRVDPPAVQPGKADQWQGRVVRGGSFFTAPAPAPWQRMAVLPGERSSFYGFRPVADVAPR